MREKYEKSSFNTDIPAALPRQLTVSQRVTARHPVTRQLHDGDVLTIAPDCYRQASHQFHFPFLRNQCCRAEKHEAIDMMMHRTSMAIRRIEVVGRIWALWP